MTKKIVSQVALHRAYNYMIPTATKRKVQRGITVHLYLYYHRADLNFDGTTFP